MDTLWYILGYTCSILTAFCFPAAFAGYLHGRDVKAAREAQQRRDDARMQEAFNEEGF